MRAKVEPAFEYHNEQVGSVVEAWGRSFKLDVLEQLVLHFSSPLITERFPGSKFRISAASAQGTLLSLTIECEDWAQPKEFVLTEEGGLCY